MFVESFIRTFSAEEFENTFVNRIRVPLDNASLVVAVITIIAFVFSSFKDFLLDNRRLDSFLFYRLVSLGRLNSLLFFLLFSLRRLDLRLLFLETSQMVFVSFTFYTSNGQNTTWFFTVA